MVPFTAISFFLSPLGQFPLPLTIFSSNSPVDLCRRLLSGLRVRCSLTDALSFGVTISRVFPLLPIIFSFLSPL